MSQKIIIIKAISHGWANAFRLSAIAEARQAVHQSSLLRCTHPQHPQHPGGAHA